MAMNGNVIDLTPAERKNLPSSTAGSPFDAWTRLYPSFNEGKVFDLANYDVRAIKDMLKQEGAARKVEQVLTLPIRSAAWEIRAAPGGDREYRYIRDQLDNRLDRVIDQLTTAISFRKAFFELTFTLDGDTVNLASIDYRPPASCEAGWDPKSGSPQGFRQRLGNPGGYLSMQQNTSMPGYVDIEPDRSFVFVHGSYREPIEGISDLDVALWCYSTAKKVQFLWFQFLEQQSLPKTVVYGDDPTQAGDNADAVMAAKASAVIAWPRPNDPSAKTFEVLSSNGTGAGQFLEAISWLEGKMSASVLAGFTDLAGLASHSRTQGSYALSADQSEFFLAARQAVADEIAEAVSRDLFAHLCRLQFGADAKPPTLTIGPLSKHDKDRAINMLNALITAPQFNVPTGFVDLLINSTSGYLGLPVDAVAQLVKDHPTQDPALVKAKAGAMGAGIANGTLGPDGLPVPVNADGVAPVVAPNPPPDGSPDAALAHAGPEATLREALALAATIDAFVERTDAGEDPRAVLGDLTGQG